MIVEFDGFSHYKQPEVIKKDYESKLFFENMGYSVVRIPYFIQLSKDAVKVLFGVELVHELFDERIPSLGVKGKNTPAFLCGAGVKRMVEEFKLFPEQYKANLDFLEQEKDEFLSGASLLRMLHEN